MNDDSLLAEKYRTQRALDERAGHDLFKYASDAHARVEDLAIRLGLKLEYGIPTLQQSSTEKQTVSTT